MNIVTNSETSSLIVRLMEARRPIDPAAMAAVRDTLTKEKTTVEELLIRRNLASEQDIQQGLAAGISEYQVKIDKDGLLASVHNIMGRSGSLA